MLSDARLRQLGRRLVAFYAPELLSPEELAQYEVWLRERWSAPEVPETEWTSRGRALGALDEMRNDASLDCAMIAEVEAYLRQFDRPAG